MMAGGTGSRLAPMTKVVSKHLLPVYNKPMIYYPLTTLMLCGIREILIICDSRDEDIYRSLLGDGSRWGCAFSYAKQHGAGGVAEAYVVGESFVGSEPSTLILGDNIFYGDRLGAVFAQAVANNPGATIFGHHVSDPQRYGVVEYGTDLKIISVEEKPTHPKSNWAVAGLYVYDADVVSIVKGLNRSSRGELEITDINRAYLEAGKLNLVRLGRGYTWLDAGTPDGLLEAAEFVRTVEHRQGYRIACPEEVAFQLGFIDREQLARIADDHQGSAYGAYLKELATA